MRFVRQLLRMASRFGVQVYQRYTEQVTNLLAVEYGAALNQCGPPGVKPVEHDSQRAIRSTALTDLRQLSTGESAWPTADFIWVEASTRKPTT